jgi:ketosteroid isomerase-like protein
MSTAPASVVRSYLDAMQRGDWDAGLAHTAPGVVRRVPGDSPLGGERRGRAAALDYIRSVTAHASEIDVELVDRLVGERNVALLARERITHDDIRLEALRTNVYRVENGAITEISIFESDQHAGEHPRYGALPKLFANGARLVNTSRQYPEIMTVDQFVARRSALVHAGELTCFEETEMAGTSKVFGNVAHRFSSYAMRGTMNGTAFEAKGAISTQFIRMPSGWKITSMVWDDELPGESHRDRDTSSSSGA